MPRPGPRSFAKPGVTISTAFDMTLNSHYLGCNWIDGKPVFRTIGLGIGGNGSSTVIIPPLAGTIDTLISLQQTSQPTASQAAVTDFDLATFDEATRTVTLTHATINLTDITLVIIATYTIVGGTLAI